MPRTPRSVALGLASLMALAWVAGTGVGPVRAAAQAVPDDPGLGRQWALERIGAPEAWQVATGEGTTIAIVDSGVDLRHPDLADKIDGSTDCVGHDDAPGGCLDGAGSDDAGHGTHVAGIAAASTGNGQGIAGVAPRARLLAVRVLAADCDGASPERGCDAEGTESDVAEGVRWAADHGADVINLSLGSVTQAVIGPGEEFGDALEHAWSAGAIPVLVAGNDLLLPGSLVDVPAVIVGATDRDDGRASYSNGVGNVRWAVAAPGGEEDTAESCESTEPNGILSTFYRPPTDAGAGGTSGYACVAGTSMAAPHVSGALAVLRSAGFTPEAAVDRLLATATDLGAPGDDATYGAGRVDLAAALDGVAPTGQPVRSAGSGGPTGTDVTTTTTPPPEPGGGGDGDVAGDDGGGLGAAPVVAPTVPVASGGGTTTVPPPAGDVSGDGGTAPPPATGGGDGTTTDPVVDEDAIGNPLDALGDDGVPMGPASAAVLAVVAVLAAHAWRYLSTASWARRTPMR